MNKPPQPLTGAPSIPQPSPSPGLAQGAYPPGQAPSVVFAQPPPPMNTSTQTRPFVPGPVLLTSYQQGGFRSLQPYYQNRPTMTSSAPRVQPGSNPQPVGQSHVYSPNNQVMMIPQQTLQFPSSQAPAYFIQSGQYRAPFIPQAQQYSGTGGYYIGAGSEYTYEPSLAARERRGGGGRGSGRENGRLALHGAPLTSQRYPAAGSYYPAQLPHTVVMPQPQQAARPPPQPTPPAPSQPRRARKMIRICDPNQGGRDITEEILSGVRVSSTPTPPQSAGPEGSGIPQTNGENVPTAAVARAGMRTESTPPPPAKTPEPATVSVLPPPPTPVKPVAEIKESVDDKRVLIPASEEDSSAAQSPPAAPTSPAPVEVPSPSTTTQEANGGSAVDAVPTPPPAATSPQDQAQDSSTATSSPTPHTGPVQSDDSKLAKEEDSENHEEADGPVPPPATVTAKPTPSEEPAPAAVVANGSSGPTEKQEAPAVPDMPTSEAEVVVEEPKLVAQPEETQQQLPNGLPTRDPPEELHRGALAEAEAAAKVTEEAALKVTEEAALKVTEEAALKVTEEAALKVTEAAQDVQSGPAVQAAKVTEAAPKVTEEVGEAEEKAEDAPSATESSPVGDSTMQAAALTDPQTQQLKDLDKKDDVLNEESAEKPLPEPPVAEREPSQPPAATTQAEEAEQGLQEDTLDGKVTRPEAPKPSNHKYQYKEEGWKPIDVEAKKHYDRDFLLGFQFVGVSLQKPEGLPNIDVVLDKAHMVPMRPADPSRMMSCGPDFTPSFANLGRPSQSGRNLPPSSGPRRSQQGVRKEPRKLAFSLSLTDDVQLNKAENAWKPAVKKPASRNSGEPAEEDDAEAAKTQELFRRVRGVLNKLTPQMFQQLMKQFTELTIDTDERLMGVIDLIFEKAISEPSFSVAYANMCRCLMGLKVPTADKQQPGEKPRVVNFRTLLLNRCQTEFEKDMDDDKIFDLKQKELDAAAEEEERQRLTEELEQAKDKARYRSLGNMKFIGELFKLKMLTEPIMHDCVVKLLKNHDEESLECLCRLLSTIGKDLDIDKAKRRMDQYFTQMEKIIKEKKTSSRIRFMLQDVLDLRKSQWVPRRGDQGPKTIDRIHKEAEMEEQREQVKVQQQFISMSTKKEMGGRGGSTGRGGGGPHHMGGGRNSQPQDEGWSTVPISKNRPIDTNRLSKITKPGALDASSQLLAPGGMGMFGSWGRGSNGGIGAKTTAADQDPGRAAPSTLNRFSALQQSGPSSSSSQDADRNQPHRRSTSREGKDRDRPRDRFDQRESHDNRSTDLFHTANTKRSFSRESDERSRGGDRRGPGDAVRRVASMTDDRDRSSRDRGNRGHGSRDRSSRDRSSQDRERSKDSVKREAAPTPPPSKPAMSEEEVDKKSTAIIEEYLHINDLKEAVQCVRELNSASLLFVFVRNGVESTLERSTIARQHIGLLLHQLVSNGTLVPEQYYKGLYEILEVADDMAIDVPHIWLYLAEIITPMLHDGGMPMGQLFREVSKPLQPMGKAGVLLVQILHLLCKEQSHKKAGATWKEAVLSWKDFLPEDEDVAAFVAEQKVEFTLGDECENLTPKELSSEEISKHLDRLFKDKSNNQRIYDWVEANLNEQQIGANKFVRALMTSVCQAAIICDNLHKVDVEQIKQRAILLQKYLCDEQKELQALYALQALMVHLEQPPNLLRMFFDTLYDEDVIKEEAFYKWETCKDPAEQQGKGVALKSVTAFFTWLREAEEESDNNS
ncbi:eukaryotic translation initiation factor 4 gamma 1a isoform X2 [Engraulis encrasicolus]|uniref:eukaryotic translation initiation factor 4 gamma 1a isoform X2 n=1 Tax=Engraulis encrasicolus TaxID=184585 RepID=UPI002FCF334E